VKYRGGKPRGFTVLAAGPKTDHMAAGEFNSSRTPRRGNRGGSSGINTRTPDVSVGVGPSTGPDNTRLTYRSRVLRGVAFPRNCRQLLQIKVFNPRRNCIESTTGNAIKLTRFTLAVKPRGTLAVFSVESDVVDFPP
jgi:hypothetical protein